MFYYYFRVLSYLNFHACIKMCFLICTCSCLINIVVDCGWMIREWAVCLFKCFVLYITYVLYFVLFYVCGIWSPSKMRWRISRGYQTYQSEISIAKWTLLAVPWQCIINHSAVIPSSSLADSHIHTHMLFSVIQCVSVIRMAIILKLMSTILCTLVEVQGSRFKRSQGINTEEHMEISIKY